MECLVAESFKIGDLVQLKSGGPIMTVREVANIDGVAKAWCDWFDGKKENRADYPLASLKHVSV
jgi:uncharacterized protein YodC (DUF2158 family)